MSNLSKLCFQLNYHPNFDIGYFTLTMNRQQNQFEIRQLEKDEIQQFSLVNLNVQMTPDDPCDQDVTPDLQCHDRPLNEHQLMFLLNTILKDFLRPLLESYHIHVMVVE